MKFRSMMCVVLGAAMFPAAAQTLTGNGPWENDTRIGRNLFRVESVDVSAHHGRLRVEIPNRRGRMAIFLRRGSAPTLQNFDALISLPGNVSPGELELTNLTNTRLQDGRWFIGFYSQTGGSLSYRVVRDSVPSHVPGMGAQFTPEGTSFRIWTPNAQSVHVAGTFNGWNSSSQLLQNESGGFRSVFVRGVPAGAQYKYVVRNGSQTLWRQDPWSYRVTNSVGNSVVYNQNAFNWTNQNFSTPTWDRMVIYQMHIGTFNDLPGGGPGNFNSAIARLDSLRDLGVNTIKLLPVQEFAGDFSWGYNPALPFSVESAYGGPDEFKRFVNEAHARGIAVLVDLVHNHYGPSDLEMWRWDGWFSGNGGGIFFYNDARAATPWGDTRPDFGRGEVRQYIRDNALYWLEQFRVDGIRWDSTLNIRRTNQGDNPDGWSLMQWINNEVDSRMPWKIQIAEDMQMNEWISRPTGAGGAGFDSQWEPDFVHPLRPLMTAPDDNGRNMGSLGYAVGRNYNGNWLHRIIYTESHDEVANGRSRVAQEIDPGNPGSYWARKRSTLGAAVLMTSPGIPMIFQGQEVLEDGWFQDTDPVDWSKEVTFAGIRSLYRDLIRMRTNAGGFSAGLTGSNLNIFLQDNSNKVLAYHRWRNGGPNDDVIVITNWANRTLNNYRVGLPRSGRWQVVFNSDWNGYSSDFGNTFTADVDTEGVPMHGFGQSANFRIGPYSAVILVQR